MRSGACAACPRTRPRPTCWRRPPPRSSSESSSSTAAPQRLPPSSTPRRSGGPSWRLPATGARPRQQACPARRRPPRRLVAGWPRPSNATPSSSAGSPPPTSCAPAPTLRRAPATTGSRLRQARLDGMAAELARVLVDGADCPVCGSTEHPRPAEAAPDAVSREAEDAAAQALRSQIASAPPPPRRWRHWTPSSPPPGRRPAATARSPTCAAPAMPLRPTLSG